MSCPECGSQLADEANRYCVDCGFYRSPYASRGERSTTPYVAPTPDLWDELYGDDAPTGRDTDPWDDFYVDEPWEP